MRENEEDDYISLIEEAAAKRFPYGSGVNYFDALQNSSRGDFMDGALWYEEHTRSLFTRLANIVIRFSNDYESDPESESDRTLYTEIEEVIKDVKEIEVYPKDRINPTYPFKNLTRTIAELRERNRQLDKDWREMIDKEVALESTIKELQNKINKNVLPAERQNLQTD